MRRVVFVAAVHAPDKGDEGLYSPSLRARDAVARSFVQYAKHNTVSFAKVLKAFDNGDIVRVTIERVGRT